MTGPNKIVNKFCSEINEGRKEVWTDGQTDKKEVWIDWQKTKRKCGKIDKETKGSKDWWTNRQKEVWTDGQTDKKEVWTDGLLFCHFSAH